MQVDRYPGTGMRATTAPPPPTSSPSERTTHPNRIAGLVALAIGTVALVSVQWGIDGGGRVDFRIYYRSIRSMGGGGGGLYDYGTNGWNFLYPPIAAIVLRPLTALSENAAAHVWLVASVALGGAAFWAVVGGLRSARFPAAVRPAVVVACLWTVPAFLSFRMGQINPLIASLLVADVVALQRRHRFGGIATGLAAALKVSPLLVIVMMFAGGRRREATRGLATFAAVGALAAIALPAETVTYWRDVVVGVSDANGSTTALNASLFPLVGLVTGSGTTQWAVFAPLGLALLALGAHRARHRWTHDAVGAVTIAMTLTYLVSPLTWVHHQWFATIAALLWIDRARSWRDWVVAAAGLFALLDPLGLGEASRLHTIVLVAFGILTVLFLPAEPDFPTAPPVAQDGSVRPGHRAPEERAERRGAHV